jgi:hypothetical protein
VALRSELVTIAVGPSVAVLFGTVGSAVVVETTTELVTLPVTFDATATTRATVTVAPFATRPWLHVTVAVPPQLHPADDVDTKLKPAGNVSTTVASAASDGPLLRTLT